MASSVSSGLSANAADMFFVDVVDVVIAFIVSCTVRYV